MTAGALVALTTPATLHASLTIAGVEMYRYVPLSFDGEGHVSISEVNGGNGQMSFTVEDAASALAPQKGDEVKLWDHTNGRILFGGFVTYIKRQRAFSGRGVIYTVQCTSYDILLDTRYIISWVSRDHAGGHIRKLTSDRVIVQRLCHYATVGGDSSSQLHAPDATISQTNTSMETVRITKATLRQALEQVADTATTLGDTPTRHFYVDFERRLHYYRDQEGNAAPYRIADSYYTTKVLATTGLVELWACREVSGATLYGALAYANATLAGGYTQGVTSVGVVNEPMYRSLTLNGSSGYFTVSGANLHPGDTWTVELWFKRASIGAAMALWSGGTNDILIGFDSSDHIHVQKEGTGDHFLSDDAYTSTTSWRHLVVTRSPGNTDVYLNGVAIAGTPTVRTFSAAAGAVNVGRKLSTTDQFFAGTIQDVAVYSTKVSAASVLAHYNQGRSITPIALSDEILIGTDIAHRVYVDGKNAAGSGWVPSGARFDGWQAEAVIDRPDSDGAGKKSDFGQAFLGQHKFGTRSLSFTVINADGWRVGQLVYVTDTALGFSAEPWEIVQIDTDVGLGNGVRTYDITCGALRPSMVRRLGGQGRKR